MKLAIQYFTITLLVMHSVNAQEASVSFTGPRTLMMALLEIQKATGMPISYEEPPYESTGDLIRTTPASHPGLRPMLVARTSPNAVIVALPGLGSASDPMTFVETIVNAYHNAGLPGRYKVVRRQGSIDVIPSEVAGVSGGTKAITPIMSRAVTFPYAERSVIETMRLIVGAMSRASGRDVRLLATPFNPEMPVRVAMSADGSSVADELSLLATKLGIPAVSYQLVFDPNDASYYLTVTRRSSDHPAGRGTRAPNPASKDNPFFPRTKP